MKDREKEMLKSLLRNEVGNCKALLRYIVKTEKKRGVWAAEGWEDWLEQYGVKA